MKTLRNTPTQARSTSRVDSILAAAREHYAVVGRDRFSSGDVASLAGCSVGTVYRYFEDRVALMNAIDPYRDQHAEKISRILARVNHEMDTVPEGQEDYVGTLSDVLDIIESAPSR